MVMKDDVSQVELCSNFRLVNATTERKAIYARSDGLCTDVNDGTKAHDIHSQSPVKQPGNQKGPPQVGVCSRLVEGIRSLQSKAPTK